MNGLTISNGSGLQVGSATLAQANATSGGVDQAAVDNFRDTLLGSDFRHHPRFGANMLEFAANAPVNDATRDAMVAVYFEALSDPMTPELERSVLRLGTEFVSLPYQSAPESGPAIADSIARLVDRGEITAEQLFSMVDPGFQANVTDGSRALLTRIADGAVLQELAERVLDASLASPTDNRGSFSRAFGLIAAADIANMAAANGFGRAANSVVAAIAEDIRAGNVTARTMIEANGNQANTIIAERSGLNALSSLLNATPDSAANQADRDILFSALVKATPDGAGLQRFRNSDADDVSGALSELGDYFSRNAARLITADVENRTLVGAVPGAGAYYDLLVADFARNVLLHPDNNNLSALTDSLGEVMANLSAAALDPNAPADVRNRATQDFAMLSGSLARAIEGSVADAGRRASDQIALARVVTDQISNAAIKYATTATGPAGFVVSAAGKEQVTQFWNGIRDLATAAEQGRATDASMPLLVIAQAFRDTIGSIRSEDGGSQLSFQFDETFDTVRNR